MILVYRDARLRSILHPDKSLRSSSTGSLQLEDVLKIIICLSIVAPLLFIGGCSQKPVEVLISPTEYRVNEVASPLATPVVDELVRMKPKHVVFIKCPDTPNAKVLQIDRELVARIALKIQLSTVSESHLGCR